MQILKYNYHDAVIEKVELTETVFSLYIGLYSIFYPAKPKIKLQFSIGTHYNRCNKWVIELISEVDDGEDELGARINNISIQTENYGSANMLCKIDCEYMNTLKFKITAVKETEI
ncbi:hypothetical protein [Pedobacter frigiditerrae]|uniref:hypothetical protein n=1 Tax=Pedobacter frigiditerrae TaxID=2530452 RepID=UPI00292E12F1|nr:hypothetical protein [Pedobacter frigiditerrae]